MTYAVLLAWLLSRPAIPDTTPHHWPIRRPEVAAEVIVRAALETEDAKLYAAILDVFAARESGYRPSAIGDHGHSCGAWQTPCAHTPMGHGKALEQARLAIRMFRASFAGCPEYPLAIYGTGHCTRWGGERIALIRGELDGEPLVWP